MVRFMHPAQQIVLQDYFDAIADAERVAADFSARLVACDGEADHVHLLVKYPPTVSISKLVNSMKGVGSRMLLRDRADIRRKCPKGCGRRAILPPAVAARPSPSSRTMSRASANRRQKACSIPPPPEGKVFPGRLVNIFPAVKDEDFRTSPVRIELTGYVSS